MSDSDDKRPRAVPDRFLGKLADPANERVVDELMDCIAMGDGIAGACRKMGLGASTVRAILNPNSKNFVPAIYEKYQLAKEEYVDSLRTEAVRRAVHGHDEMVVFNGQDTGLRQKKFSDAILLKLLAANAPEFRDRTEVVQYNANVDLNSMADMTAEQRAKLRELLQSMNSEGADDEA